MINDGIKDWIIGRIRDHSIAEIDGYLMMAVGIGIGNGSQDSWDGWDQSVEK